MNRLIIFFIGLLIPASKPCLPTVTISCIQNLPSLESKIKFANFFLRKQSLADVTNIIDQTKSLYPYLPYFLGTNNKTTYLLLLQNNYEMRANGGFFGSYAVATLVNGEPTLRFQDIYVPDGAIIGHVEPPAPIQKSFQQGWFKLRDSDWEPDFTKAAPTIRWFFDKGNEVNPDILMTLSLSTIEKIIRVIGEVDVPEYNLRLNSDNLYSLLQNQAEVNAFQGSSQKKDVVTAAGKAAFKKLKTLSSKEYLAIAKILLTDLDHGNSVVNSKNETVQKKLEEIGWAGKVTIPACQQNSCLNDAVMFVEANMGANKANCCVERKTVHSITKGETEINHLITLTFKNNSPLENPSPPRFYGGNYISYLRYYLPENATNIRLTAQPTLPKTLLQYPAPFDGINQKTFDLKDNLGMREVGFFHTTQAGTSSHLQLSYSLPLDGNPENYQLNLLKQNGMTASPSEIILFGKSLSTNLETSQTFTSPL